MLPDPMTPRPLARFSLFESSDLDEARERVARVFCPHRLDMIGRGSFDACHNHVSGERLSLNYIQYGAKTLIAPGELTDFYLLQIPLRVVLRSATARITTIRARKRRRC
jgi:hypothetical protein